MKMMQRNTDETTSASDANEVGAKVGHSLTSDERRYGNNVTSRYSKQNRADSLRSLLRS